MTTKAPAWLRPVVDFAPLAVFLIAFEMRGIMVATGALMVVTAAVLVAAVVYTRKVPVVPLVTAIIVGTFGGLTIWLKDETFIKLKPTILYGLFAAALAGGMATGRIFLKSMLGHALMMDHLGWRRLTLRFIGFFLAMALANEVLRRLLTTEQWVLWKVGGGLGLTVLFMLLQTPLIKRHAVVEGDS